MIANFYMKFLIPNSRIYDLSGRRVLHPRTGLYIVDGKKMWIK